MGEAAFWGKGGAVGVSFLGMLVQADIKKATGIKTATHENFRADKRERYTSGSLCGNSRGRARSGGFFILVRRVIYYRAILRQISTRGYHPQQSECAKFM